MAALQGIPMSQGYVHIVCVLLNYPMTVLEEKDPASGWVLLCFVLFLFFFLPRGQTSSEYNFVSPNKILWCWGCGGLDVVVKAVCGAGRCVLFITDPLHTRCFFFFFFQSANLYMYIQAMFTDEIPSQGVDWLVHDYPYMELHGKVSNSVRPVPRSAFQGQRMLSGLISLLRCHIEAKYHASFMHQQHNTVSCDGVTETM